MLQEKRIDCKSFEENLYRLVCNLGKELYAEVLTEWDCELHKARDRKIYRDKGLRKTILKTLMGDVEYKRHVYKFTFEDGRKGIVYLLDDAIGKTESGFFSDALLERISAMVCEMPYRKAAEAISELTGQAVSHAAIWNITQQLGGCIDEIERSDAKKAKQSEGVGEIETKVLFEEQDGIYLHLQGNDRKEYGKGHEMKLSIAYDGAKKTGKKRFELTNKVACANFGGVEKFYSRKEGVIAANYNIDEITMRILNGDGASWIKRSIDADTTYQLDKFHRNRALRRAAVDEDTRDEMLEILYDENIDYLLVYIDTLADSVSDEKQAETLRDLYTYFTNNKEGLTPYWRRVKLPEPPEGKEYRNLGAMESNVFSIIGNRMKGRRKCWSINGGNNLARLLCLKSTGKLRKAISTLSSHMPEKYSDEIITVFSAAKVKDKEGSGYNGFQSVMIPSSQKWLKDIAKIKLVYS